MKSMLHEASCIIKAIEKAWTESGKPREFTVNVLEPGEKGFLGMTKRPAVVSITYQNARPETGKNDRRDGNQQRPNRHDRGNQSSGGKYDNKRRDASGQDRQDRNERPGRSERTERFDRSDRPERTDRNDRNDRSERPERNERNERRDRPERQDRSERTERYDRSENNMMTDQRPANSPVKQSREGERPERREREEFDELAVWTPELVTDISTEFAAVMGIFGITSPYVVDADKRALSITFSEEIFSEAEDERHVFMSLSHLLMQMLKKKHKKKLRGFHIALITPKHGKSESSEPIA